MIWPERVIFANGERVLMKLAHRVNANCWKTFQVFKTWKVFVEISKYH